LSGFTIIFVLVNLPQVALNWMAFSLRWNRLIKLAFGETSKRIQAEPLNYCLEVIVGSIQSVFDLYVIWKDSISLIMLILLHKAILL